MDIIIAVRPEEFSIRNEGEGIRCEVSSKVFLGKYIQYGLKFSDDMLVPGQPSIEYSQDVGHAEHILEVGDVVTLHPNPAKVNLFTADGSHSLMEGVVRDE